MYIHIVHKQMHVHVCLKVVLSKTPVLQNTTVPSVFSAKIELMSTSSHVTTLTNVITVDIKSVYYTFKF